MAEREREKRRKGKKGDTERKREGKSRYLVPCSANNPPRGVDWDKSPTDAATPRQGNKGWAGFSGGLSINFLLLSFGRFLVGASPLRNFPPNSPGDYAIGVM